MPAMVSATVLNQGANQLLLKSTTIPTLDRIRFIAVVVMDIVVVGATAVVTAT